MSGLATPTSFVVLLLIFAIGALASLALSKKDRLANLFGNGLAIVGSLFGIVLSTSVFFGNHSIVSSTKLASFPLLSISIHIDKLASFFIFTICLVALFCSIYGIGYVRSYYKRYSLGQLGFLYNLFIIGMLLVVSSANAILFMFAWEIMALASYFLVTYDRHDKANVRAGFIYLIMTHVGAALILLAFLLLYGQVHSFDFAAIKAGAASMPMAVKSAVFILAFIGLGTKAGVVPLHIWLPSAHPAAPSHVSALMSGVMIKTGIYMMIRLALDILQPFPSWWGVAVLIAGIISSLIGVLYALTEHDIKRLLAYHSIENIGIILLGLGGAMIFTSLHQPALVTLSLAAALFHTLNHATFKSLLFLSAGSLIHATHTRDIEKYGGLISRIPVTATFFLIGSMAISALPPFNGFFSEWLTYQSLFQGAAIDNQYISWTFLIAIGALALTGGLALACFTKAFGVSFLARPRSKQAEQATEFSKWMFVGMGGLAVLCLAIGLSAASVVSKLEGAAQQIAGVTGKASAYAVGPKHSLQVDHGYATVSPLSLFMMLVAVTLTVWLVARYVINRRQVVTLDRTWDCGVDLTERMEITSTGFARSIVLIFQGLLRPTLQRELEYNDSSSRFTPSSHKVSLGVHDVYRKYFYDPLYGMLVNLSYKAKQIQNGNINSYLFYIFLTLIITLIVGVR